MNLTERIIIAIVALAMLPGAIWGWIWIAMDFKGWTVVFRGRDGNDQ